MKKKYVILTVLLIVSITVILVGFNNINKEKIEAASKTEEYLDKIEKEEMKLSDETKDIPSMIKNKHKITVVFLGDSITEQNETTEGGLNHVGLIKNWLQEAYPNQFNVVNSGISGNNIKQMSERLDADVLNHSPQVVVISSGLNDANGSSSLTVDEFTSFYEDIVIRLKDSGVKEIVLRTPNPTLNPNDNNKLQPYINATIDIANKNEVNLFDFNESLNDEINEGNITQEAIMYDTVHLNEDGQEVLYTDTKKYLEENVFQ